MQSIKMTGQSGVEGNEMIVIHLLWYHLLTEKQSVGGGGSLDLGLC